MAVNGLALQGMSHSEAISVFKNIRVGKVVLHLARRDAATRRFVQNLSAKFMNIIKLNDSIQYKHLCFEIYILIFSGGTKLHHVMTWMHWKNEK